MSMKVYPFGSVEVAVAAADIVSIFSKSPVKIYRLNAGLPNMPPTKTHFATVAGDADYQSGAFAAAARLVIEAGPSEAVVNIGTAAVPTERRGLRGQGDPAALNATGTLTAAMIASGIVTSTTAAAVTATLNTGTIMDAALQMEVGESFDWSVINTGAANAFTVTAAATGHTVVGAGAVAASSSATFRTRKTAVATFVTYRLAG